MPEEEVMTHPFKPIGEYETEIENIYNKQLKALYHKLTS